MSDSSKLFGDNYNREENSPSQHSPSVLFQNLVNLPTEIRQIILLKLSECKGGLQSILSLRAASSFTKEWVDDRFTETFHKRIFSKAQIAVALDTESLERFLSVLPPFPVTSLRLKTPRIHYYTNRKVAGIDFYVFLHSKDSQLLWADFVAFWSSRLQSVEIDCLRCTINEAQLQFLFSSCPFIDTVRTTVAEEGILQNRSSSLMKEFVLCNKDLFSLDYTKVAEIIKQIVLVKQNLKILELPIRYSEDLRRITKFIEGYNQDSTLQITLSVFMTDLDLDQELNDVKRAFYSFVRAVASSKSNIEITSLSDSLLRHVEDHISLEEARSFFDRVTHMTHMYFFRDSNERPRISEFIYLRRLDSIMPKDFVPAIDYPKSLERLGIYGNLNEVVCRSLPNWLKCLELEWPNWTHVELLGKFLVLIDEHFSLLRSLKLNGACVQTKVAVINSQRTYVNSFEKLRFLKIDLKFEYEDTTECSRYILTDILRLNLKLEVLKLASSTGSTNYPLELHSDCTRQIIEGSLKDTLIHIAFGESRSESIRFQDQDDKENLISLAENNLENHMKNHATTHTRCFCFHDLE